MSVVCDNCARQMLSPGTILNDRYEVLRWLADGGQSTIYLATDSRTFDRQVVIKEFKLGVGTSVDLDTAMRQFETSARMLSQLSHPGIVQVIDYFFSEEQKPILVTEYIQGETLSERLIAAWYGLPEDEVLNLADQLCEVLTYLHSQTPPVIYRDLTPGNIILTAGDRVKLIDFGIARTFKQGKSSDTEPLGTAGYAPPEQHGKGQTGPYSDVYSLGATLLHALTGYDPSLTPFMLPRADRVHGDLKTVSPAVANALTKATQVDVRKRFQSVEDFRKALHRTGFRTVGRGAWIGLGITALIVSIVLCAGIGLMLNSAFGLFNPAATPTARASIAGNGLTPTPTLTVSVASRPTPVQAQTPNASPQPTSSPQPTTATETAAAPSPSPSPLPTLTSALTATVAATSAAPAEITATTPLATSTAQPSPSPSPTSSPTATPAPTSTQTPTPTQPPTPTLRPSATPTPAPTTVVVLAPVIGASNLPEARIDGVAIPGATKPDQPFNVIVWGSNVGGAPADSGSITLSFQDAESVEFLNVDNNVVREEPADCIFTNDSYARLITTGSRCNQIVSYVTCLPAQTPITYPIAESYFINWQAGMQHFIHARVTPRKGTSAVAVDIRVAMTSARAQGQPCNALISPGASETNNRDQQAFPVRRFYVIVSDAAP